MPLRSRWESLQNQLRNYRRVLIAFSGGTDSTLLAAAARITLGRENVLAVTAVSASLPKKERTATVQLALELNVDHRFAETRELLNPSYQSNPVNRCFFCKKELFQQLGPIAEQHDMRLADGFNLSDRSDYRPGFQAAVESQVIHPLDDAGLGKKEIRTLSRWLKLSTWNKPASPCLSSRVPYGTTITPEILRQIENAESVLHDEKFLIVRVRHYGSLARIEVPIQQLPQIKDSACWSRICDRLRKIGYADIELDPRGFASGRLNEAIV